MTNEREVRKERNFWGKESEVIYENGRKVGEIRPEERGGLFGIGAETVKVEYSADGKEVGYTKQEERGGFLEIGTEKANVRYDSRGNEVGYSRIEERGGILGVGADHVRVEYDKNGNELGRTTWEKRGGLLGIGGERVRVTRSNAATWKGPSESSEGIGALVGIIGVIVGGLIVFGLYTQHGINTAVRHEPTPHGTRLYNVVASPVPSGEIYTEVGTAPTPPGTSFTDFDDSNYIAVDPPVLPETIAAFIGSRGLRIPAFLSKYCSFDFTSGGSPFVVQADLDGDGHLDYVITAENNERRTTTIAFLASGQVHVLKGWEYISEIKARGPIQAWEGRVNVQHDSFEGFACEASSMIFIYNAATSRIDGYWNSF